MSTWTPDPRSTVEVINAALPLRIVGVETTDPVVTWFGDEWSLTVWCDWHVDALGIDSDSQDAMDRVWDLIGYRICGIEVTSGGPVFVLGPEARLAVLEGDDDDPWVLSLPETTITGGVGGPYW